MPAFWPLTGEPPAGKILLHPERAATSFDLQHITRPTMTKHFGSCHCGGVRFEIDTQEPLDPYFRCNCSLCSRKGAIMGEAARADLQVTTGQALLSVYAWNTGEAQHYFCRVCGIYTHHVMRGSTDRVGVNMGCIEGVDVHAIGEVVVGGGKKLSLVGQPSGQA